MAVRSTPQTGTYSSRITRIPGTDPLAFQWDIENVGEEYSVVKISADQYKDPKEATITLYMSRKGWYDCFADISLNRLADPDVPIFVTYLRGDGFRLPVWKVQSRRDSGAYVTHLQMDPEPDGDLRFKSLQASVVQKLTETGDPDGLVAVTDSGAYYVDGTNGDIPVAESGVLEVRINPYSTNSGLQIYRSFSDPAHQYARVRSGGLWGVWTAI